MELKQLYTVSEKISGSLLIVPYGIETEEARRIKDNSLTAFNRTLWN